jgi:hypothetical protein
MNIAFLYNREMTLCSDICWKVCSHVMTFKLNSVLIMCSLHLSRTVSGFLWLGVQKGGRVWEGVLPSSWVFGGWAGEKKYKLFTMRCFSELIFKLILNTERSYTGLLICGYIRGCKRLLLNLLKFVMFGACLVLP